MRNSLRQFICVLSLSVVLFGNSCGAPSSIEVLDSIPGPRLVFGRTVVVDYLLSIEFDERVFPPNGPWTESVEVELNVVSGIAPTEVLGRFFRVDDDATRLEGLIQEDRVRTSALGVLQLQEDLTGQSPAQEPFRKRYYLCFELLEGQIARVDWFISAHIDWEGDDNEVPEKAGYSFDIRQFPQRRGARCPG